MSNYSESKKKFDDIRNKSGEMMFRMAISHLMDVGIRHLTEEIVEDTCNKMMQEDDSKAFMTNDFKCALVRTAYELAQIPHTDLLVYIQREVAYDVFDGMPSYERVIQLLKNCMNNIEQWNDCRNELTLGEFEDIGFDDDEMTAFGFAYVLDAREEEDEEN
jgi:CO dehydrogenase/acetyl-CoA synthase epsilon subunit